MKKILLTLCISALVLSAKSQVVFNEMVPDPGCQGQTCNNEYFELYNTTGSTVNLDCYTVVAYDFVTSGAWVYQLPAVSIGPFGYLLFSSGKPVNYKCGTYDSTNITNWNTVVATATLAHYTRSGDDLINRTVGITTDFIAIGGGNTAALAIMLFDPAGKLVNGFFTNNNANIPTEITTLHGLNIPLSGTCAANTTLDFASISAPQAEVLNVQQAVGNNNDYYRTRDGFCGTWQKGQNCPTGSNPIGEFTPNRSNGGAPPIAPNTIVIAPTQGGCNNVGPGVTSWNIGVTISDQSLLTAQVRIYSDNDHSLTLTPGDGAQVGGGFVTQVNVQTNFLNVPINTGAAAIVQVITASGCITVTRAFASTCAPTPVTLKSFTATRMTSNVMLKWTTSTELNNSGFFIERNVAGVWQDVVFVPSQAQNGNSNAELQYSYVDANNVKGITQYRLRQVDIDMKYKYSDIRAVRGDGQIGKINIYPNPTNDGRVNVVFDDANVMRNVSVADMTGRVVREYKGITNNNIIIENLQAGIYTVKILAPETGEQVVQKIVVNKR